MACGAARLEAAGEVSLTYTLSGEPLFPTFGFGSNSVRQLRGRLGDQGLRGYPARLRGQALAFAGPNRSWAHDDDGAEEGGVATLVPLPDEVAWGTVTYLTAEQLAVLDGYEGVPYVYQRQEFRAEVLQLREWRPIPVVAYVKRSRSRRWYPPSEAYCCAILRNLRGSFPSLHSLALRDVDGKVRAHWQHPGFPQLGLGAFLFEVGIRAREPWRLPHRIGPAREALLRAGVNGRAEALLAALDSGAPPGLEEEELAIVRRLLSLTGAGSALPDDTHEDDAQAERAPPEEFPCGAEGVPPPESGLRVHARGPAFNAATCS